MKIIGLIAFFVFAALWVLIGAGYNFGALALLIDAPSLMGIVGMTLAVALISGYGPLVFPGFKAAWSQKTAAALSPHERKKAAAMFKQMKKTAALVAALMGLTNFVLILANAHDIEALAANLALTALPAIYALILTAVILNPAIAALAANN